MSEATVHIVKGATFTKSWVMKRRVNNAKTIIDLTGSVFECRGAYPDKAPIFSISTTAGGMTITSAEGGAVTMELTPAQTSTFRTIKSSNDKEELAFADVFWTDADGKRLRIFRLYFDIEHTA